MNDRKRTGKPVSTGIGIVAGIVGAVIGHAVARSIPFQLTVQLIAGTVAGLLVGLVPYFLARSRGELRLARIALGVCALCGLVLGLILAVPACIAFVVVIVTKPPAKETPPPEWPPTSGNPFGRE